MNPWSGPDWSNETSWMKSTSHFMPVIVAQNQSPDHTYIYFEECQTLKSTSVPNPVKILVKIAVEW